MGQRDIIALLVKLFNRYKVSYILTGSFAGSYWGYPRATHDIDFVVELEQSDDMNLISVLKDLGKEFEIDLTSIKRAVEAHRQFNIVHRDTELKIDFWVAKDTELGKNEFKRRVFVNVFGERVAIASAEDLILMKLPDLTVGVSSPRCFVGSEIPPKQKILRIHPRTHVRGLLRRGIKLSWIKEVYSDRHFRDCVGIFERQKNETPRSKLSRYLWLGFSSWSLLILRCKQRGIRRFKNKLNEKYLLENAKKLGVTKFLAEARTGKYY